MIATAIGHAIGAYRGGLGWNLGRGMGPAGRPEGKLGPNECVVQRRASSNRRVAEGVCGRGEVVCGWGVGCVGGRVGEGGLAGGQIGTKRVTLVQGHI